jgi:hypothetical protein
MNVINDILNEKVRIRNHLVDIREDLWHLKIYKKQMKA